MLISVNPFKKLEIYGTNLMEKYYNPNPNISLNLPPHLFEISQKAFTNLMAKFNPQSIVISGFLIILLIFTIIIFFLFNPIILGFLFIILIFLLLRFHFEINFLIYPFIIFPCFPFCLTLISYFL